MNRDTLILWLAGFGIPATILDDDRVKLELAQKRVDPVGLLRALQGAIYGLGVRNEDIAAFSKPQVQLELLSLAESGGESFIPWAEAFK